MAIAERNIDIDLERHILTHIDLSAIFAQHFKAVDIAQRNIDV